MADEEKAREGMLSKEQKDELIAALRKKGVPNACPMCGTGKWTIAEGYFSHTLQSDLTKYLLAGASIPTIAILCENCGFVSQHALGVLGFLPQPEQKEVQK